VPAAPLGIVFQSKNPPKSVTPSSFTFTAPAINEAHPETHIVSHLTLIAEDSASHAKGFINKLGCRPDPPELLAVALGNCFVDDLLSGAFGPAGMINSADMLAEYLPLWAKTSEQGGRIWRLLGATKLQSTPEVDAFTIEHLRLLPYVLPSAGASSALIVKVPITVQQVYTGRILFFVVCICTRCIHPPSYTPSSLFRFEGSPQEGDYKGARPSTAARPRFP
jgi:hypothetical protein